MNKEFKVGLLAVVSIAVFYIGFNYLKGINFFSPTTAYYVAYDKVGGLIVSNPVMIDGFTVGKVGDIKLVQGDSNLIWVRLEVSNDVAMGKGTVAHLVNNDAFGSKAIVLEVFNRNTPLLYGDTLVGEIEKGLLDELADRTVPITDNIQVTIRRINTILDNLSGSSEQIKNIIGNVDTTMHQLKITEIKINRNLDQTLSNLNKALVTYDSLGASLTGLAESTGALTDSLQQIEFQKTLDETNALLQETKGLMADIRTNEGTLGKLMTDDSLYHNLNSMISSFDTLATHLNDNPRHFFAPFGKKAKKKKGN